MRILVTTYPFAASTSALAGHDIEFNSLKRKLTHEELVGQLSEYAPDVIVAGTEKYDKATLDIVPSLKMISRVGIGVDGIDLEECRKRGIVVTNTPDAPSNAVAELVICQMVNMARKVQVVDQAMRKGKWTRHIGFDLARETVGIIGCGRIGTLLAEKLLSFKCNTLVHDIVAAKADRAGWYGAQTSTKDEILASARIISVHIPLTEDTKDYISYKELEKMGKDACLINMSRGGIVNEAALYEWLKKNPDASAAIDTFETEPYTGNLLELENCFVTPHLGSCTKESRRQMEAGAIDEVSNFLNKLSFMSRIV